MKKKSGRRACVGPTRPTSDPTALGTALTAAVVYTSEYETFP